MAATSLLRSRRRAGVARAAPSTSGTLAATALMAAGRVSVEPGESATSLVARATGSALDAISERGKASRGDRTMLDALGPAVDALRAAAAADAPIDAAGRPVRLACGTGGG